MKKLKLGCEVLIQSKKYKNVPSAIVTTFATRVLTKEKFPPVTEFLLQNGYHIKKIFSPEHGYYLASAAGENVEHTIDFRTNLPIFSLYGKNKEILPEWSKDIKVIFYDINDLCLRFYTFGSTLYYVLKSAKNLNKKIVILDRPNPLSAKHVDGNVLEAKYKSFVGISSVPVRHGLTPAEFALYLNSEEKIYADLEIIPMENYNRKLWWDDYFGTIWFNPSPNINSLSTALIYSGTCLFEGVNVSFGNGTTRPFEQIGSPWINSNVWIKKIKKYIKNTDIVEFVETIFVPKKGIYENQLCKGIQIIIKKRDKVSMFAVAVALLRALYETHGKFFKFVPLINQPNIFWIDKLAGGSEVRKFIETGKPSFTILLKKWSNECNIFRKQVKKYFLYH